MQDGDGGEECTEVGRRGEQVQKEEDIRPLPPLQLLQAQGKV